MDRSADGLTHRLRGAFTVPSLRTLLTAGSSCAAIAAPEADRIISAMLSTDFLGYAAAGFTTASFLPQVWLTFKTRDVSGISLGMYSAFTFGVALWLVYGLTLNAWPIVAANAVTLALALSILVMRLRYGRAPGPKRWPAEPPSA